MVPALQFKAALDKLQKQILHHGDAPIVQLLPLLLQLKGKPYSLDWSHFMLEPVFRFHNQPRMLLLKAARQVGKSQTLSAAQIIQAVTVKFFNIITVLPLQEQTRKFSVNYVKPLIASSPLRNFLIETSSVDSVLQRTFKNGSNLFYSYTSGDATRVRGIAADACFFDEVQSQDVEVIPIVEQCMGASIHKLLRFGGTPLTRDNTIEVYWQDSSQAIWHIPCEETGCKHVNRCCKDSDLLEMLGDKTLVCAKCKKPINSRLGYWVHTFPARQRTFAGYHIPQPILPLHYEIPSNWYLLKEFQRNKPTYAFYNEVLGESYDVGAKVITEDELNAASKEVVPIQPSQFKPGNYLMSSVGVDWGGRGKEKSTDTDDFISNTAMALAALRADGVIEILYLHKVPYSTDVGLEAPMVADICKDAHVDWCAMDYGGQGDLREQMVIASSWPKERIVPFTYSVMAPRKPIVFFEPPTRRGVRISYTLDKPRSILLLCELIKRKMVLLPNLDRYRQDHLRDFLNIYEESMDNPRGSPTRLIKRISRKHDDVVHAINFAVMAIYHATKRWPKLAEAFVDRTDE